MTRGAGRLADESSVASQRVANQLRAEILGGRITPGSRLRQEEIAARTGTSRVPVREALRILESQGFVTFKSNSGAWVSTLEMDECQAIYRLREKIEPLALEESMPRLSTQDHERLEALQDQIEEDFSVDKFLALDRELHLRTYSGCQVEIFTSAVERFWNTTQHYRRAYLSLVPPPEIWVINAEHRLLINAVVRNDVSSATRVLAMHINRTREQLARHPEVFRDTVAPMRAPKN